MLSTKLKIRIYGDPCLRKKSLPVREVGPAQRMLIASLIETMLQNKGVGLAAPQVGINEQIFVADIGDGPMAFINPHILKRRGAEVMEEGCLSIPGVLVNVKRAKTIVVQFVDEHNRKVKRECSELLARVIQHETDHLNGKLIVDHVPWGQKLKVRKKLKDIERQNKEQKTE